MKKIKFIAMTAAMGMAFAACQPSLIDGPEPFKTVEAEVLAEGITYVQYEDEACTIPNEAGNYLKFNSSAGVVQIFLEGNDAPIYTGAGGVVKIPVKRGQEPSANLIFRLVNGDGTFTETVKTFSCTPPTELAPEMLLLVSDNGQKVWKYAATSPYGNAGYTETGANFNAPGAIDGKWWGVDCADSLTTQLAHAGGTATGDESGNAYMVFTEDGVVTTYGPTGTKIRDGKFVVKDYDPARGSKWGLAKLTTDKAATLFPWKVNGGGTPVTEFDVMYLTAQDMTLTHVPEGTGGWSEITFWSFIAGSPDPLTMEGKWTYAAADAYGNAGNSGAGANFNAPGVVDGKWWGATPADLSGQLDHTGGVAYGDEAEGAYMVFEGNTVTTYGPDGTKVRGGTWEAVMNDYASGAGRGAAGWELGKLNVDQPALLFPWSINEGGLGVTSYDIMYYDANNMTLVYTKGNGAGSWGEISFWNFVRKTE